MASTVCPQRIIKEAIRLLNTLEPQNAEDEEATDNCILELGYLERALYRDGITSIKINTWEQ